MGDDTKKTDLADEDILSCDVSDDALEAAAGMEQRDVSRPPMCTLLHFVCI